MRIIPSFILLTVVFLSATNVVMAQNNLLENEIVQIAKTIRGEIGVAIVHLENQHKAIINGFTRKKFFPANWGRSLNKTAYTQPLAIRQ